MMGFLVGLPLGIFRLLFTLLLLLVRLAVPIAVIVLVVVLLRRSRRSGGAQDAPQSPREPEFHGPVYTVDYEEVDEEG